VTGPGGTPNGEATTAAEPGRPSGSALAYRPYLDGLRALAVVLVVAFHSGLGWFDGGYVGVDVFFVLSGFLVTRLLVADVRRGGTVDFRRFYARRFRRLLPAAAVTLLVTAAVFTALATRVEVADGAGSFRAAFLYVTNWYFIREGAGYFGADLSADPVLHFWSLAVEEQFYLLWPLAFGGLALATRRFAGKHRTRALVAIVAGAAVASAVWAVALRNRDPLRAYYGTDARAYQLLAGALLALSPGLIRALRRSPGPARIVATAALVAIPVTASRLVALGPVSRGLVVTGVTLALLAALEAAPGGPARFALTRPTAVALGRISYGIYLWHWPVIWVLDREFSATPVETFAVTVTVATGLAAASHLLLEQPVRRSVRLDRHRLAVIAVGLVVSVVGALVLVPRITDRATGTTALGGEAPTVGGIDPRSLDLSGRDWRGPFPGCEGKRPDACIVRRGRGAHVLLIGDSHARALLPAIREIAERDDLTLSVSIRGGCPWPRGLYAVPILDPSATRRCRTQKEDLYERVLPALAPDVVVAANFPYERPETDLPIGYLGPDDSPTPGPEQRRWAVDRTQASAREITGAGAGLVIVEPVPLAPESFDPLRCLAGARTVDECRYVAATEPSWIETEYRRLAAEPEGPAVLDLDRTVCPYLPICDPVVGGEVVKWDRQHVTSEFARSIAPRIEQYLRAQGMIGS